MLLVMIMHAWNASMHGSFFQLHSIQVKVVDISTFLNRNTTIQL